MNEQTGNAKEEFMSALEFLDKADYEAAIVGLRKAMELAQNEGNHTVYARAINALGVTYESAGNEGMADDCYLKGLCYAKRNHLGSLECIFYNNFGTRYQNLGDSARALEYFLKAEMNMVSYLEENQENAPSFIANCLNIGDCYRNEEMFLEAEVYLQKAKEYIQKYDITAFDFPFAIFYTCFLKEKGDIDYAKEHLGKLIEYAGSVNENMPDYAQCIRRLVELLLELKEYDRVLEVLEVFETFVTNSSNIALNLQLAEHYIEYYRSIEDLENYRNACVEHAEYYMRSQKQKQEEEIQMLNLKVHLSLSELNSLESNEATKK